MISSPDVSQQEAKARLEMKKNYSILVIFSFFIKRAFDFIVALIGLILLAPFFIVIGHFIRRDSPGPVFYKCARMGKDQHPFQMLKFRTMYDLQASFDGPKITCKEDSRITPFGHWLRDTKINELPQLWNVLIGEMSLVGPRPEDVAIAKEWPLDARLEILSVRPGITSPASILYRNEESILSKANLMEDYLKNILPDKMRLDRLYIKNRSFSTDFDIIFWTMAIFIPQIVKMKIPEGYLFAGPVRSLTNRYLSWFFVDVVTSLIVVGIVGFLWRLQGPLNWGIGYLAALSLVIAFIFSFVNSLAGLNRIIWDKATAYDAIGLVISSSFVTFLLLVFNILQANYEWFLFEPLPMVMIITIGLLAQIGFILVRYRLRVVTAAANIWLAWRKNAFKVGERVLIVGAGESFHIANWLLRRNEYRYILTIVGVIDDEIPTRYGMRLDGCQVLGTTADLPELVKAKEISVIVYTTSKIDTAIKEYSLELQKNSGVRLVFLENLTKIISQQLTIPVRSPQHSMWSEDYLKFLAVHDNVTGLPNRYSFQSRLQHSYAFAKRYKTRTAVMFVSVNGLKDVLDPLDQAAWDEILKCISDRLVNLHRESDMLAFLGGHDFGFILENIPDENAITSAVKRLLDVLSKPVCYNNQDLIMQATISICTDLENGCFDTEDFNNKESILEYLILNRKVIAVTDE